MSFLFHLFGSCLKGELFPLFWRNFFNPAMSFEKKTVTITPLIGNAFLLSSKGEAKVVINPPSKSTFSEFNKKLAELVSARSLVVLTHSQEKIAETWHNNLVIMPGKGTRSGNKIPVRKEKLFPIEPNWTLSFPSYQQKDETPFLLIKSSNLTLLYVSSQVEVESPPQVDLLLIPRSVLNKSLGEVDTINHLPVFIGCEPQFIITQKEEGRDPTEKINKIPNLFLLPLNHSITVARHLSRVKKLEIEEDLSEVLPELEFL